MCFSPHKLLLTFIVIAIIPAQSGSDTTTTTMKTNEHEAGAQSGFLERTECGDRIGGWRGEKKRKVVFGCKVLAA